MESPPADAKHDAASGHSVRSDMDEACFEELIDRLRTATSSSERAEAARTMGMVGNRLGNVHLIAALFDDAGEVRDAATEALARLGDSTATAGAKTDPPAIVGPTDTHADDVAAEISLESDKHQTIIPQLECDPRALDISVFPSTEAKPAEDEPAAGDTLDAIRRSLDETAELATVGENEDRSSLPVYPDVSVDRDPRQADEVELGQREKEVLRHKAAEEEKLATAVAARVKAETEAQHFAEEDARLRLEINKLRLAAEELARTRIGMQAEREAAAEEARLAEAARARADAEAAHLAEMERLRGEEEALRSAIAAFALRRNEVEAARQKSDRESLRLAEEREQLAAAEEARRSEADRLRREAEERARADQKQFQAQVESLRRLAEEVAARRAEVDAAREQAVAELQRLAEIEARMKTADAARQQVEAERLRLEAELTQQVEDERRRLEEVRLRAQAQQQQLEDDERSRVAAEEQRLARLAAERDRIEAEAEQRAAQERQISSQIESLRIADMQARKRIADADARRLTADEQHRIVAEKAQRLEAEARKAEIEEQRILARLEAVRRNVAIETSSAAEQESRIKEETEQLRRLEGEQRHRIEAAARDRAEVEQRLQQERERLQLEQDERLRASEKFNRLLEEQYPSTATEADEWRDDPAENLRPSKPPSISEPDTSFTGNPVVSAPLSSATAAAANGKGNGSSVGSIDDDDVGSAAAFVSEPDGFSSIVARFDDPLSEVRNAAARELRTFDPPRMVELFNRALDEALPERRRNIGSAIAASGLASEVIDMLGGESREETYSALCLLLTMAKSGEVQPLVHAIENHDNVYVRIAAVRLLTLNGQEEIANAAARRRLEGRI